jgi:hypothetical protein
MELYWELDTALLAAAAEEYLGREYARVWRAFCQASPTFEQDRPDAYEWWIVQEHPDYPIPSDHGSVLTYYAVRAKLKETPAGGGVLCINVDLGEEMTPMSCATQSQMLSDGNTFQPPDWEAVQKTFEQLSPEGQLAVRPLILD